MTIKHPTPKLIIARSIIIILLGLLIVFNACNKEDEEITTVPKVKTITYYQNDLQKSQQTFVYDLSGRLTKKSFSNGDWISYTYEDGIVIENNYSSQWQITQTDTIVLNNKGLAISKNHGNQTMEYDAEGYLIKKNNLTGERYSFLYKIENGNMVEGSMIADNNYMTLRVMQTNTFLLNSTNTTGNDNMGIAFWGKQDKELVSNIAYSQGSPLVLEYEFDSKNRVSKCKVSDGTSRVFTYY